ncbi:unnamed protein product [Rhizophagus irregularis]|nr:unnamed protein product [Rhizophagus irregularis]
MLQDTALTTIDEESRIKAHNRYYWIAGLDSSNSMIFGRVFYTVDVHGTRIVYFSHWVNSPADRSTISPCRGCLLHDATIEDGPLRVRSVGSKLSHRSCLTFLPSYRCLQLFHMSSRIDASCNNINLFLSPFILCFFFKILLGYSHVRIPETFLVNLPSPSLPEDAIVSPQLPALSSDSDLDIRLGTEHHIYLHAKRFKPYSISSVDIPCGWVQKNESLILASGVFSWSKGPTSPQASELGFILKVIRMLLQRSSIVFYTSRPYNAIFSGFQHSSSEKRIRFPYYTLWMAILICAKDSFIDCSFQVIKEDTTDPFLSRCLALMELATNSDPSPSFELLLGSCLSQRLLVVSLCTGVPLLVDPVLYWRDFSDM